MCKLIKFFFKQKMAVNIWYCKVFSTLLILGIIYLVIHLIHKGEVSNRLTAKEITNVNLLLNNNLSILIDTTGKKQFQVDTTEIKDTVIVKSNKTKTHGINVYDETAQLDSLKKQTLLYIFSIYPPVDSTDSLATVKYFAEFDKNTFAVMISQYSFKSKSFFFLTDWWIYLEIIFWSLFGLICSLLYNVSEIVRQGKFNENEIPGHFSKLIYTPFMVLIIYLALDMLTLDNDINVSVHGKGIIVLSFILGFFSRRTVELLNRIKEIILPGKEPKSPTVVPVLKEEIGTLDIIAEAVKEKGKFWVNTLPNVTGFSIRNKITRGKELEEPALMFKVTKKGGELEYGEIPEFLTYKRSIDNKEYKIKTDVLEEEMPDAYNGENKPFSLDLSYNISRKNSNQKGSVGLMLKDEAGSDKKYLISCYHLICEPELKQNIKVYPNTENDIDFLITPSEKEMKIKGVVKVGKLDLDSDFAIVKLINQVEISNTFQLPDKNTFVPKGIISVNLKDINKKVKMYGGKSGYKEGFIKSQYSAQTISFGNNITQYIKGLIEISPIGELGDSGATVVLNENEMVLGIVICGNNESTYVLPMKDFIDKNKYKLEISELENRTE